MARILLIEDDSTIADGIVLGLKSHGMMVDWFSDAKQGEMALQDGMFDAVLLDLTLPKGDGMTVLKNWRAKHIDTPVLIITARDAIANRVAGLNAGADDYLVKPFALDEVIARLQALMRRSQGRSQPEVRYGEVAYQPHNQQVSYQGKTVELTIKEVAILEQMLTHPKQIHSRASLEDKLYGWKQDIESNAIEVHIHHLRKKLGNDFILTKRGIGYYLNPAHNQR
ncbi:probable two-component transcriptional response regulator (ompR family) [Psychrobacter arcticus 273-4]|uniref:Probable two-component transcriptional response regulator (OmpR family) n=1 Tax=Psychrobacter arcticus (strain DSM 17307 / VKM B-2377 / 273-4) TaxID=259536 RepID=Q4FPY5_PSYA2|nr:response regulator [Psychrobacter arcticus]AAZ19923.1 probable two-component transcriptional response regulator (ompR family) [Psychrobacter arcticus 273-4]